MLKAAIASLLLVAGTSAIAETADQLESIMSHNICRSNYGPYRQVVAKDECGCGGMGARVCSGKSEVACLQRVNEENATIIRWNAWVSSCRSRR